VSERVGREQPNDVDDSASFAFSAVEDVLVVSHSVSEVSKSRQCVVERISVGTRWEGFVDVGNPDGFLVRILLTPTQNTPNRTQGNNGPILDRR